MGLRRLGGAGLRRAHLRGAGVAGLLVALYLGSGLVSTWPAVKHAEDQFLAQGLQGIPGTAAPGDHLQVVWQLWLPGHQLGRGASPLRDPYSFQPVVEPRPNFAGWPFGLPFWPLHALLGAVGAWNAFVLLGYLGAGGLTFLWLRSLGLGALPAAVGGLAFALAPYRTVQAGAGHLLAWVSMLLPLSLFAWERRLYVVSAAALASIPLSGQVHLALGAIPFFLLYALVRGGRRAWAGLATGGAVLAGLLVWATSIRGSIGEGRDFAEVERYSADLADFLARAPRHGLEPYVFLGWALPLLALAGAALLRNRTALVLGVGALVPAALALGANLPGYRFVWENLPALGSTRVPGRLMPIACLAVAGLAAFAVSRIRWPIAGALAIALVLADLTFDVFPVRPTAADEENGVYAASRGAGPGRLLELPIQPPDRQEASIYLYYAMQAPRERPAGYSTIAPEDSARTLRRLAPCPNEEDLDALGIRLIAVFGPSSCVPWGRLSARDGPVAMYERRDG